MRCNHCGRPAKWSTGPTYALCDRCMKASDKYDRKHGLPVPVRKPAP
jgi:hypothetical protein